MAFSSLAVATIIWSAGSLWKGCGSTVERYDKTGERGTNLSFGISRAVFIQSSGSHEIPTFFFSRSLLNSHGFHRATSIVNDIVVNLNGQIKGKNVYFRWQ